MLRTLDDALALRAALTAGSPRLAIIGAGFIGCEVAATARKLGLEVTLFDIAPTPMTPLGPELGELCADLHREHGVDLRLGAPADTIDAALVLAVRGAGSTLSGRAMTQSRVSSQCGSRLATMSVIVPRGSTA